jgi:hypothetical protein
MAVGLQTDGFQRPPFPVRRFTVEEYHKMIQAGILGEDDPVELLEGWIVAKTPRNPAQDVAIDQAQDAIRPRLPAGWRVRVQSAITTPDSEPEPHLAVVPGPANRYRASHPGPKDIALIVEAADSSLDHDRKEKGPLYARVAIPIYWIINLVASQVEVYTDPTGPAGAAHYRSRKDFGPNDSVPLVIEGKEVASIPVRELLPT